MKHTLLRACLICMLVAALSCAALASCATTPCEHTYGEPTVKTAATCTEKGSQTLACSKCGDVKTEDIPALGHDGHTTCSVCQKEIVKADQLTPVIPENAEGIKLTFKDLTVTETYVGEDDAVTVVNGTCHIYPVEDGVFTYGNIKVTADGVTTLLDLYYDGNVILAEFSQGSPTFDITETSGKMLLSPSDLVAAFSSDPVRLFGEEAAPVLETILYVYEMYILPFVDGGGIVVPDTEELLPGDMLPDDSAVSDMMLQLMNESLLTFFTVQSVEGGNDVTLDLSALHDWNDKMAEATLVTLLDAVAGEGTFQTIVGAIPSLLDVKVSDLIAFLEENTGMTILELADIADDIIQVYTDEQITLAQLLGAPIETLLTNEAFLNTTVADFISQAMADPEADTQPSRDDLLGMIAAVATQLQTTKLYDLVNNNAGAEFKAQIDEAIDEIESQMQYTIHVKDGAFAGYTMRIADMMTVDMKAITGGFSYGFSAEGLTGGIELTFAPDKLTDMTAYNTLYEELVAATPQDFPAVFAQNGFVALNDKTFVYTDDSSVMIFEDEGIAYVDTTIISAEYDMPFAMLISGDYGMLMFTATWETAEYNFTPGTEPDLATLTPVTVERTLTTASLYFDLGGATPAAE